MQLENYFNQLEQDEKEVLFKLTAERVKNRYADIWADRKMQPKPDIPNMEMVVDEAVNAGPPAPPEIFSIEGGDLPFLYAEHFSTIFGAKSTLKTAVARAVAIWLIEHDYFVLWIDTDGDDARIIAQNMLEAGAKPEDLKKNFQIISRVGCDLSSLKNQEWWDRIKFVFVDSMNPAITKFGRSNDDDAVSKFEEAWIHPFTHRGIGVLAIGHIGHAIENSSRMRGSARMAEGVRGQAIECRKLIAPDLQNGTVGVSELISRKDTPGRGHPVDKTIGWVLADPTATPRCVRLVRNLPFEFATDVMEAKSNGVRDHILKIVDTHDPLSKTGIVGLMRIGGQDKERFAAVKALIEEGTLKIVKGKVYKSTDTDTALGISLT